MKTKVTSTLGSFAFFGFTKNPNLIELKLRQRLAIVPRTIDFGTAGTFFFHTSTGNVVETEEAIGLKLGFVRSPEMRPYSVEQLLSEQAIGPELIKPQMFRGNALLACFGKKKPVFSAFKTFVSAPQLYYSTIEDGILFATGLRYLIAMLDHVEVDEKSIVSQFLFGAVHGTATHFRNIYRLFVGELLKWNDGQLTLKLVQDLRFLNEDLQFGQVDDGTLDFLYERFLELINSYTCDIESSKDCYANLLSGGVDSSLIQLLINQVRPDPKPKSFSYIVQEPSYKIELEYAKQAVSIFDTKHTFVDITEQEFTGLLLEATDILGQPVVSMAEVCKLGLAKALASMGDTPQYYFVAQGADALFGLDISIKIKMIETLKRIPASQTALVMAGTLLNPFTGWGQRMLNAANHLAHIEDNYHLNSPINTEATNSMFDLAQRCFGNDSVQKALEDRRSLEEKYLDSYNYTEKVHMIDLLSKCYEVEIQSSQLFLACNKEQLYPFMDEDIIRLTMAVPPRLRYVKGQREKYILKELLERNITSPVTRQPKGGSMFYPDLHRWMRSGALKEMIRDISLPGSLTCADIDKLLETPVRSLHILSIWHLLAFDLFQKHVRQSGKSLSNLEVISNLLD